ncbi:MAG: DNA primase [Microthrixaceae bacterium]|nr:DNA primase [Microthrixaceae bacterium]
MGILDEDVVRVRESADIVAVVSQHTQLRKVGTNWVGLCPFHNEKSGSLSVSQTKGFYYCFGCRASGDVITFVREMEHLDFAGAVEWLAAKAGITLRYTERDEGESRKRQRRLTELMEQAVDWYHRRLLNGTDAGPARGYLRSRGFDRETVEQFRLGWAPDAWDELNRALGAPRDLLVDSGLGLVNRRGRLQDFFRARVLFPIYDDQGNPVAFGGRKLPDADGPKYQNSREGPLYNKSRTLYALNWAKADVVNSAEAIVCEGYTDVIGFFRAGLPRAVATCGTALTEDHVRHLKRFTNRIVLAYDADEAGQAAAERVYEWERRHEIEVSVLGLPAGTDPDELARSDPDALRKAVGEAIPFLGFRVGRVMHGANLATPEGRSRAAEAAIDAIREHPDPLVRDQYLMEVAGWSRSDIDQLRAQLARPARVRAERPTRSARADDDGRVLLAERPTAASVPRESVELEALRILIDRPADIADRLHPTLFREGLTRRAYLAASTAPIHDAVEEAEPAVSDLLTRLAVSEATGRVDDVLVGLALEASKRAMVALQGEARGAADPLDYAPTIQGLKLMSDDLLGDEPSMESLDRLLAWLAEHAVDLGC